MTDFALTTLSLDQWERYERIANMMATATLTVPEHYRGKPGNCMAVVLQAAQWAMNPYAVAQKTHFVSGAIGYESQLIAAICNTSTLLATRLDYEWFGPWEKIIGKFVEKESRTKKNDFGDAQKYRVPAWDVDDEHGLGVHVWATLKGESQPRKLTLLLTQARVRNSPLWADDPKQQLAYLAAKRWSRLHTPELLLGVYSPDELASGRPDVIDMGPVEEVIDTEAARPASRTEAVKNKMREQQQRKGKAAPPVFDDVALAIASAETPQQFEHAAGLAAQLENAYERERARKLYSEALAKAKAKAKADAGGAAPPEEGQVEQGESQAEFSLDGVPAFDESGDELPPLKVQHAIEQSTEPDTLELAADLVRFIKNDAERARLHRLAHDKLGTMQRG